MVRRFASVNAYVNVSLVMTKLYANMSVQYTTIFHGCKNCNFQIKKCDFFLFLLIT